MNTLIIIGNLCGDPVSRTTQGGKNVTTFTVAVNRRRTADGKQETDYFKVNAWGELGNLCHKWLIKGRKVCVTGRVSVSTYQAQNGEMRANLDVLADSVEFLSPANQAPQEAPQAQQPAPKPAGGFTQVDEEDLPWK